VSFRDRTGWTLPHHVFIPLYPACSVLFILIPFTAPKTEWY
jgi:hypothetical protein